MLNLSFEFEYNMWVNLVGYDTATATEQKLEHSMWGQPSSKGVLASHPTSRKHQVSGSLCTALASMELMAT